MTGILLFTCLLSIANLVHGNHIGVPHVSIVPPIKPRSVEIQAQIVMNSLGKHEYVPCFSHVVQYKQPHEPELSWKFTNVTSLRDGKFSLEGLLPGTTYQVRVACKDEHKSVGPFTDPIRVETPLRLNLPGSTEGPPEKSEADKAENAEEWPEAFQLIQDPVPDEHIEGQSLGVLGGWANLTCTAHPKSSLEEKHLRFEWSHLNTTLEEAYGVHILNEGNVSVLQVLLKTDTLFGNYTCRVFQDLSLEPMEVGKQGIEVIRAKKAPTPKLIPDLITMTRAQFRVEVHEEGLGVPLPFVGYIIQYKPICHIGGEWLMANYTLHDEGFTIEDLHPNEGYYIRAAMRNTGSVSSFGQYWKIRTSSAVPVQMQPAEISGTIAKSRMPSNNSIILILVCLFLERTS